MKQNTNIKPQSKTDTQKSKSNFSRRNPSTNKVPQKPNPPKPPTKNPKSQSPQKSPRKKSTEKPPIEGEKYIPSMLNPQETYSPSDNNLKLNSSPNIQNTYQQPKLTQAELFGSLDFSNFSMMERERMFQREKREAEMRLELDQQIQEKKRRDAEVKAKKDREDAEYERRYKKQCQEMFEP